MASIYDLSVTAGSNTTIDSVDVSGATGKVKDGDNVMRSLAAFTAQWIDDQGGIATTAGTANGQTVTLASAFTANANGHVFTVKIGAGLTNTSTTVNLNVNSIGNVRVKVNYDGLAGDPIPGDIKAGAYATFLDNGTNFILLNPQQRAPYPSGHLYGLNPTTNAGDTTNDLDFAAGTARSDDDSINMDFAAAITGKQTDVAWAVGSSAGLLATGAAVTNTTYYLFGIKRPDTGVCDVAADSSATGANLAANTNAAYTKKVAIGYLIRSGGVNGTPVYYGQGATQPSGSLLQSKIATYTTNTNLTTTIPIDDTIPQSGEGTQILSLAIVPKSTTSKLRCRFSGCVADTNTESIAAAMFTTAGGVNAAQAWYGVITSGHTLTASMEFEYTPGTISEQTIAVRAGPQANTMRLNGGATTRYFGGAIAATLVVEEIKA